MKTGFKINLKRRLFKFMAISLIGFLPLWYSIYSDIASSEPFKQAVFAISKSTAVIDSLGRPTSIKLKIFSTSHYRDSTGKISAEFTASVVGDQKKGEVSTEVDNFRGHWEFHNSTMLVNGGAITSIDLNKTSI